MSTTLLYQCSGAIEELQRVIQCVQTPAAAIRLWERGLRPSQRHKLGGDLRTAFQDGGTIGIWTKLYRVSPQRALVEVASALGFVDRLTGDWLSRELDLPGGLPTDLGLVPSWCKDRRELRLYGRVVRR